VKRKNFVLDSFALLAYFQGEPGGTTVRDILKEASAGSVSVMLPVVNLGEIYYIVARKRGRETALAIVEDISRLPVQLLDAGTDRVIAAADIKARHPLSYADAFVAAAAEEYARGHHRHGRSRIQAA